MCWSRFRRRQKPRQEGTSASRGRLSRRRTRVVYEKAIVHDAVSVRSLLVQRLIRIFVKPALALAPLTDRTLNAARRLDDASAKGRRSQHVRVVERELGGVRTESMTHAFGPQSAMTILYMHGGAFLAGSVATHRRICERLAYLTGATVHSIDYVQVPLGTIADSVSDAIDAYAALTGEVPDPSKIVLAGDSAGGYLAAKVAELASRRGLPVPAAMLLFSPLLSVDPERTDKNVVRVRRPRDAYLPMRRIGKVRALWLPEGSKVEGYASPLFASRYISTPTFMTAVDDEHLRPEVEAMALLLSERGVEVETHLWRHLIHAFPVAADLFPESRLALQLAADFARKHVGELDEPRTVDPDADVEVLVGEIAADG